MASHPPPTRSSSRNDIKRAESVNSHYSRSLSRAATPDWARAGRIRSKSRSSLASTPAPKMSRDRSTSSLAESIITSKPSFDRVELQDRIQSLEKLVQQHELRASELESKNVEKSAEFQLELTKARESLEQARIDKLTEIENVKQELNQTSRLELDRVRDESTTLKQILKAQRDSFEKQTLAFEKERLDLQSQLNQLRSAGQSLCGVYESKISDLEEVRLNQLHESELVAQELKVAKLALEELKQAQSNSNDALNARSSTDQSIGAAGRFEAVEIDNERLKADLKHTKERLSEVQDEAYQLKQEFESQRESHEQIVQRYEETVEQHLLSLQTAKDQITQLDKEKGSLQFKLTQLEARLKETQETMEHERAELEGLRAEVLVSNPHANSKTETDEAPTIVKNGTTGSERSEPTMTDHSSNLKYDQLASELKEKQTRIEFLESELNRHSFSNQSKASSTIEPDPRNEIRPPIIDQEKMLVIQKYQRLLLIKDEENLQLLNQVHDLEDELEAAAQNPKVNHHSKLHPLTESPNSSGPFVPMIDLQLQHRSPGLKHKASTQSLRTFDSIQRSPRYGATTSTRKSSTEDSSSQVSKELAKATQQIVGLKLIASQSNDERLKFEKANVSLRKEIEELKQHNRSLEQKLTKLIQSSGSNQRAPNLRGRGENEDPCDEIKNSDDQSRNLVDQVIIGDYKKVNKLELEIDQLNLQLANLNHKHGREVQALNQEVNELESLIESKVFEEERLEIEIKELRRLIGTTQHDKASSLARFKPAHSKGSLRRTLNSVGFGPRPKTSVGPPGLNLPPPPPLGRSRSFTNRPTESDLITDEFGSRDYPRKIEGSSDYPTHELHFEVREQSYSSSSEQYSSSRRGTTNHNTRRIREQIVFEEDEEGGREFHEFDIHQVEEEDEEDEDGYDGYEDDEDEDEKRLVNSSQAPLRDDDDFYGPKRGHQGPGSRARSQSSSQRRNPNHQYHPPRQPNHQPSPSSSSAHSLPSSHPTTVLDLPQISTLSSDRCELCEGSDHQIENCPIFSGGT